MAMFATRMGWRVSGEMLKFSSIYPRTLQNAPVCLSAPKLTTTLIQKRSLLASLGGTTALFVGASVLTVVETVLFVIRRLADAVLASLYKRFNKIQYIP